MSMKVAVQTAALWTRVMFIGLQNIVFKTCLSKRYQVDLVECSGLWKELLLWSSTTSTS